MANQKILLLILLVSLFFQINLYSNHSKKSKPIFTLMTLPKSGSHFAMHLMNLISKRNPKRHWQTDEEFGSVQNYIQIVKNCWSQGDFCLCHNPGSIETCYELKKNNIKVIFLIRDLRDCFISMYYHHCAANKTSLYRKFVSNPQQYEMLSTEDRLLELLTNHIGCFNAPLNAISPLYYDHQSRLFPRLNLAFQDPSTFCIIKFENIIGAKGGGSFNAQIKEILKVAKHVGYNFTPKDAIEIAHELNSSIYGNKNQSVTFRKGTIGEWKTHFTEELNIAFKELFGDILIKLEYEKNYNW